MENFNEKEKLLFLESNLTLTSLADGLDCLRYASTYYKGLYYQAFFSLAIGIERLLKLIFINKYRIDSGGKFPSNKILKNMGHDIYNMIKEMEPEILENKLNSEVITFLNEYSITTRYYNLDIITGRKYDFSNPIIYWAKIENDILNEYKVQIEENTSNRLIANYMNQFVDTFYFDNNLNEIDSMDYILNDLEKIEKVQKYSVLVFYKIIRKLVYLLIQDNMVNNLYPKYTEIFSAFCGNMEDEEIMAIDGWMDIIIK